MKGLDLSDVPVSSKRARANAASAMAVLEEIQEMSRNLGVTAFPKPSKELPPLGDHDTGKLDNRGLETAYTGYIGFCAYLGPKLAEATSAYRIADANLKRIKANLRVQILKEDKTAKADIEARIVDSDQYMEYDLERLKLGAMRDILQAHFAAYEEQAKALSRIIELRKLEFEQSLRSHNVGNYRGPQTAGYQGLPGKVRGRRRETDD